MPDIMHLVRCRASREQVYAALTTPEGVRAWWTEDADLDAEPGGFGEFRFYGGTKSTRVQIEDLKPPARVRWRTVWSFRSEWAGTTMEFDVRPDEGGATLLFAHRGFLKADEDYAVCTTGWGIYLSRLQEHLAAQT